MSICVPFLEKNKISDNKPIQMLNLLCMRNIPLISVKINQVLLIIKLKLSFLFVYLLVSIDLANLKVRILNIIIHNFLCIWLKALRLKA